jgi:hypothetical protein
MENIAQVEEFASSFAEDPQRLVSESVLEPRHAERNTACMGIRLWLEDSRWSEGSLNLESMLVYSFQGLQVG